MRTRSFCLVLGLLAACGGDDDGGVDAATNDAGAVDGGQDAGGGEDAGAGEDAGGDEDAGEGEDAGGDDAGLDAGAMDAGTDAAMLADGECRSEADCTGFMSCFRPGDPFCGICMDPPTCADSDECSDGQVCDAPSRSACLCGGGGMICQAHCSERTCDEGLTCDADGLCKATACTNDDECPSGFACDAETCARRTCTTDAQCAGAYCVRGSCFSEPGFCSVPPA